MTTLKPSMVDETLKKRVMILTLSPLSKDSRVLRQIDWFQKDHLVIAISPDGPDLGPVSSFRAPKAQRRGILHRISKACTLLRILSFKYLLRFLNRSDFSQRTAVFFSRIFKQAIEQGSTSALPFVNQDTLSVILNTECDIVITNDFGAIPYGLALKAVRGSTIFWISDLHEYSPDQGRRSAKFRFIKLPLIQCYLDACFRSADALFTVSEGIAKLYHATFGRTPVVIENSPPFSQIAPRPVDRNVVRLVYHGGINRSRKLKELILAMDDADDRIELHLHLLGSGHPEFVELSELARNNPRIFIHDPIPPDDIVYTLNNYDIGVYVLPPTSQNHIHALPNKFFDFIQARLMVAVGPSPEMASIVNRFRCGLTVSKFDYTCLIREVNKLSSEEIMVFKLNSGRAALEYHSGKAQERMMESIYRNKSMAGYAG